MISTLTTVPTSSTDRPWRSRPPTSLRWGESVGQVNYEIRDNPARHAELDIWLRSLADTSHGYGSDALVALTDHLSRSLGVDTFLIRPSARNPRAIRAYQKAGFIVVPMSAREQVDRYGAGEYEDTVVLVKHVSA
jgi:RimJ/RimL family protein N-acetyltransferase